MTTKSGPKGYANLYQFMVATDQFPELRQGQRRRCLEKIRKRPMTCDECRMEMGSIGSSAVSARFSELEHDGWIVSTGEQRQTTNGGVARVMRATTVDEMKAILAARFKAAA